MTRTTRTTRDDDQVRWVWKNTDSKNRSPWVPSWVVLPTQFTPPNSATSSQSNSHQKSLKNRENKKESESSSCCQRFPNLRIFVRRLLLDFRSPVGSLDALTWCHVHKWRCNRSRPSEWRWDFLDQTWAKLPSSFTLEAKGTTNQPTGNPLDNHSLYIPQKNEMCLDRKKLSLRELRASPLSPLYFLRKVSHCFAPSSTLSESWQKWTSTVYKHAECRTNQRPSTFQVMQNASYHTIYFDVSKLLKRPQSTSKSKLASKRLASRMYWLGFEKICIPCIARPAYLNTQPRRAATHCCLLLETCKGSWTSLKEAQVHLDPVFRSVWAPYAPFSKCWMIFLSSTTLRFFGGFFTWPDRLSSAAGKLANAPFRPVAPYLSAKKCCKALQGFARLCKVRVIRCQTSKRNQNESLKFYCLSFTGRSVVSRGWERLTWEGTQSESSAPKCQKNAEKISLLVYQLLIWKIYLIVLSFRQTFQRTWSNNSIAWTWTYKFSQFPRSTFRCPIALFCLSKSAAFQREVCTAHSPDMSIAAPKCRCASETICAQRTLRNSYKVCFTMFHARIPQTCEWSEYRTASALDSALIIRPLSLKVWKSICFPFILSISYFSFAFASFLDLYILCASLHNKELALLLPGLVSRKVSEIFLPNFPETFLSAQFHTCQKQSWRPGELVALEWMRKNPKLLTKRPDRLMFLVAS